MLRISTPCGARTRSTARAVPSKRAVDRDAGDDDLEGVGQGGGSVAVLYPSVGGQRGVGGRVERVSGVMVVSGRFKEAPACCKDIAFDG